MKMTTSNDKSKAQQRVDRIRAFREELEDLESQRVLQLSDEQRIRVSAHHDQALTDLALQFDVDTSDTQKQLSWGMRIASFLGALALSAAAYYFFYQFWGYFSTPFQVGVLMATPILAILGTEFAARKEKTLYFASLTAMMAFACFILNLTVLGKIFSITPSQNAFLAWSLLAFVLAYMYGLRLLLVGGIICFVGYLSATTGTWSGAYWLSFGERPENFIISGALLFFLPLVVRHNVHEGFAAIYRVFGLLNVFLPVLLLSNWGAISYFLISPDRIENIYQILGFILAGLTIWAGIRYRWRGVTNLGSTFFVIFLYTKFYDWWWDWMPKYLFFLVLGLVAIALLVLLKRLRVLNLRAAS